MFGVSEEWEYWGGVGADVVGEYGVPEYGRLEFGEFEDSAGGVDIWVSVSVPSINIEVC